MHFKAQWMISIAFIGIIIIVTIIIDLSLLRHAAHMALDQLKIVLFYTHSTHLLEKTFYAY